MWILALSFYLIGLALSAFLFLTPTFIIEPFFCNEGPAVATRVSDSLRLLELDAIADAYEDFVEANGLDLETLEPFTIDFYESGESFAEEYADLWASYPFDDFDQAYLQHWEKLDLEGKMLDFAAAHPEAFGP